jgi:hypothetical protein
MAPYYVQVKSALGELGRRIRDPGVAQMMVQRLTEEKETSVAVSAGYALVRSGGYRP